MLIFISPPLVSLQGAFCHSQAYCQLWKKVAEKMGIKRVQHLAGLGPWFLWPTFCIFFIILCSMWAEFSPSFPAVKSLTWEPLHSLTYPQSRYSPGSRRARQYLGVRLQRAAFCLSQPAGWHLEAVRNSEVCCRLRPGTMSKIPALSAGM